MDTLKISLEVDAQSFLEQESNIQIKQSEGLKFEFVEKKEKLGLTESHVLLDFIITVSSSVATKIISDLLLEFIKTKFKNKVNGIEVNQLYTTKITEDQVARMVEIARTKGRKCEV